MSIEQLRKLWREMEEKGLLVKNYTAPELPNIWDPYEPMNQGATSLGATSSGTIPPGLTSSEPTVTPEIVEPSVPESRVPEPPEMQPIYVPEEDVLNIAAIPAANTASERANNQAQTASALGEAGSKALAGFLVNVSDYYKEQRRQNLTDAYNAGLNGVDLSRKTKDDAAAGLYIDQLWAMYDAGKQDAKAAAKHENEEAMSNSVETAQHKTVDNPENISYPNNVTSGNDSNNNATADEYVPDMGAGVQYINNDTGSSGSSTKGSTNATSSGDLTSSNETEPYIISDLEKELNYMMDMMFLNGAESSAIPSVLEAYQWLKNAREKINEKDFNEKLKKTKETFYAFMGGIGNDQIARSNQIAVGKNDKVGLVDGIYQYKADQNPKQKFSFENAWGDILDFFKNLINPESPISSGFGQAGRFALGEIIKPDPEIFSKNHKDLIEAYQTGAEGVDISQELKNKAEAGGYLNEILKMYRAGETDRKIDKDMAKYKALLEKDFEYIRDMMFECGAGKSKDTEIQGIYQYFNNPGNKGKEIPQEMKDAFYGYLRGVDDDQKADAYEAVTGIKLEGLKNKVKLPDGSYSKTEETIIQEGPYKGCKITQGFNDTTNPTNRGHIGYDIGGAIDKIYPILEGVIVQIQPSQYYKEYDEKKGEWVTKTHANGITITVKHTNAQGEEYYSTYCHLSSIDPSIVKYFDDHNGKGEYPVTTSTNMGIVGKTGTGVKGVHLHLCVYTRDQTTNNPYGYTVSDHNAPFNNFDDYIVNGYYYPLPLGKDAYHSIYYDPYLVMTTNGEIISLFSDYYN